MAYRFGDIKFCEMRADMCIEGYPERNTPTILVYKDGDIKKQIITLQGLRSERTTIMGKWNLAIILTVVLNTENRLIRPPGSFT